MTPLPKIHADTQGHRDNQCISRCNTHVVAFIDVELAVVLIKGGWDALLGLDNRLDQRLIVGRAHQWLWLHAILFCIPVWDRKRGGGGWK